MKEMAAPGDAVVAAIGHYLDQSGKLLDLVLEQPNAEDLLARKLAPDAFETGFHLAVAIQFAARALCLPAGHPIPEIVEPYSPATLRSLHEAVSRALADVPPIDWDSSVSHKAGDAELTQKVADYVVTFAFPNMLFHFSQAYAGLRHQGLALGKADFDGLHQY